MNFSATLTPQASAKIPGIAIVSIQSYGVAVSNNSDGVSLQMASPAAIVSITYARPEVTVVIPGASVSVQ